MNAQIQIPAHLRNLIKPNAISAFNVSGQVRPDLRVQVKALLDAGATQSDLVNEALAAFLGTDTTAETQSTGRTVEIKINLLPNVAAAIKRNGINPSDYLNGLVVNDMEMQV